MKEKEIFSSGFNRSYKIPRDYFKDLEDKMVSRLREEKTRKRKWFIGLNLIAALFLMIILMKPLDLSDFKGNQKNMITLSELSEEVIDEYILMEYDTEVDLVLENNP